MSEDEIKPGNFMEEWLKKAKEKKPDSVIIQAICDATEEGQLNESKLLRLLLENANFNEECEKP